MPVLFITHLRQAETDDGKMWKMEEFFDFLIANKNPEATELKELYKYVQKLGGNEILDDDFSLLKISFE